MADARMTQQSRPNRLNRADVHFADDSDADGAVPHLLRHDEWRLKIHGHWHAVATVLSALHARTLVADEVPPNDPNCGDKRAAELGAYDRLLLGDADTCAAYALAVIDGAWPRFIADHL